MRRLLNFLSDLVGDQKSVSFDQTGSFEFEQYHSNLSLTSILDSSGDTIQFHLRLFNETPNDESGDRTALIQRVPGNKEKFLICTIGPYSSSTWESISKDDLIDFIIHEGAKTKTPLETFTIITPAEEGKRIGE